MAAGHTPGKPQGRALPACLAVVVAVLVVALAPDRADARFPASPADGRPTKVDCWYTPDASGTSHASAGAGITFTMLLPEDGLSGPSSGACGGQSDRSGFRASTTFYLDAWVTSLVLADRDALVASALAKAEAAGVAIPCTWAGS